jgi:hypothetical protein
MSNGDAVNPDPNQLNELVEFTPEGKFVGQFQIEATKDSSGNIIPGGAFGLALSTENGVLRLVANTSTLKIFTFKPRPSHSESQGDDFAAFFNLLGESVAPEHHHEWQVPPWSI